MNIDQGAMNFEAGMDNEKFIKAIDEAERRVKGFSKATVGEGNKIDDVFKVTAENIRIQKEVIAGLESELGNLGLSISKLPKGSIAQAELQKQAAQVKAELNAEKGALKELEVQVKATETSHVSFRTQLRHAREELIRMEQAGLRGTDGFRKMQQEVGTLKDAIDDATTQANIMANDEKGFQGVVSALSGVTGAFSAAQGAVGLFAGESENMQRIMLKVQSLMAITIGLQQVAQTLNKDSYFNIVMLTKAKLIYSSAIDKLSVSLGISTVAAQALMATLTLGLSVAITGAIVLISKMLGKSKEAKKEIEEFNKSVVDLAFKPIAALQELSLAWTNLGDTIEEKQKFIEDNADKFKTLGVNVKSVKEAEDLLINNKDRFIESLILRAKAMASAELAAEKYKQALLIEEEYKGSDKSFVWKHKKRDEMLALEKEGLDLLKQSTKLTNQEQKILRDIGASTDNITKGSIAAVEESISKLKQRYKDAANDSDREKLLVDIKKQEKLLAKMDVSSEGSSSSSKDPFKESLDKRKKQYQEYFKWINSKDPIIKKAAESEFAGMLEQGTSFLNYLKKQRDDLLSASDNTLEHRQQLKTINSMIAEETKNTIIGDFERSLQEQMSSAKSVIEMLDIISQKRKELSGDGSDLDEGKKDLLDKADESVQQTAKEETDKLIEDYANFLTRKLELNQKYTEDMILLEERLRNAQTEEERLKVQGAIDNRSAKYERDSRSSGDEEYDTLLVTYKSFEQKKESIFNEYAEKRKTAQKHNNKEMVALIDEAEAEALSKLASDEVMQSANWEILFGDLDAVATREIEKLIKLVELHKAEIGVDLSPADLVAFEDKLQQAKKVVEQRNPFKELLNGIKEYSEATDKTKKKDGFTKMFKGASSSINLVNDSLTAVVGGLDQMGIAMSEETTAMINNISGIAEGASELATGIATGNPLAIIQGSIGIISNAFELFSRDRKIEKTIQRHAKEVERLQESYEELGRAIDKALGSDRYSTQKASIENLKKQQREYSAMAEAERSKKKSDEGKAKEYDQARKDNAKEILEIIDQMREDILGMNVSDVANDLGNAIIDAFAKGEDAAEAWGKKVDDIVGNVIRKMLIQKLVEQPVGNIINKYMAQWVDDQGNFLGFDAVMNSAVAMGEELSALGPGLSNLLENLPEDIKKYLVGDGDNAGTLTGGIQGVSEETASVVGGQMNAMRINQILAMDLMRSQLMHLSEISANTKYNRYLESIDSRLNSMSSDTLRSQGLS